MRFYGRQSFPFTLHRFSVAHLTALPALTMNRLLDYSGASVTALFFGMFLYEFFEESVLMVLFWFLVSYLVRLPLDIFAVKIFSRTGLVSSMAFATVMMIVYYIALFILNTNVDFHPFVFLGLAIAGISLFNSFYWAPFHVDFAGFSTKGRHGRQLSVYYSAIRIMGVIAQVIGGFLIAEYGYSVIFLFAILMYLLSFIPMLHLPRTYVLYEFGFFESFKKLASKEFRPLTISMMAHGAEKVLSLGTKIYVLGWFAKALVNTAFGIFAASSFHSLGSIFMRTPMDAIYYEKAADAGHYVDEFTVIKETAITLGKVSMIILLIGVTSRLSLQSAFVVAAIVLVAMSLLSRFHAKNI